MRISEYRWPSLGSREWQSVEAPAPAVLAVGSGTATVVRDRRTRLLLDPAQAMLLRAGDVVHLYAEGPATGVPTVYLIATPQWLGHPRPAVANPGARATAPDPGCERLSLSASALLSFHRLQRLLEPGPAPDTSCVEAHALEFVARAYGTSRPWSGDVQSADRGGKSRHQQIADGARALMTAAPGEPHRLSDMARTLMTSPFHLAHVFRRDVGVSPHQYLMRLRLIAALHQIRAGTADLSQVALEVGFASHSHFSAVFRRTFGITPREARTVLASTAAARADGTCCCRYLPNVAPASTLDASSGIGLALT